MPDERKEDENKKGQGEEPAPEEAKAKGEEQSDTLPEKVTFWTSLLLVLSLFALLGYFHVAELRSGAAGKVPEATATVALKAAKRMDKSQWTTPVSVRNSGRVPLEEVQVAISHRSASGAKESKEVAFVYLAAGSSQIVYIVTDLPPERANLSAAVTYLKTQQKARGY